MIDCEESPEKTLLILEGDLEAKASYFHGKLAHHNIKDEEKIISDGKQKGEKKKTCWTSGGGRDNYRSKAVAVIHEKRDSWINFYATKCGMKYEDLCKISNVDQRFGIEVLKTNFVLFLLKVDVLSTIYVKTKPIVSQGRIIRNNNLDVLKYAVEKYRAICESSERFWQKNNKYKLRVIDQDLECKTSQIRAAVKARHYIKEFIQLACEKNPSTIPFIYCKLHSPDKYFPGFLEDVLFYSIRYLHEDLEKVNFQKNHAK
jgi:hypothetical protein